MELATAANVTSSTAASGDRDRQSSSLQLSSALTELSRFYASQGFSLKSDEVAARAAVVRHRVFQDFPSRLTMVEDDDGIVSTSLPASCCDSVPPDSEGKLLESKGVLVGDGVGSRSKEAPDNGAVVLHLCACPFIAVNSSLSPDYDFN